MKRLKCRGCFADAEKLDRPAGNGAHGQCRAAARVAVGFGQDDAGERQAFVKRTRGIDRVLAGGRVHHEQRFDWLNRGVYLRDFAHHIFVHVQPAGAVHQHHVHALPTRVLDRVTGDVHRGLVRLAREKLRADLGGQTREAAQWPRAGRCRR